MNRRERPFDVIVAGLGAWGSATAAALARRGLRVLGLDRFHPPHDGGSSGGHSRALLAGTPRSMQVPQLEWMATRASELWQELDDEAPVPLLQRTGALIVGRPGTTFLQTSEVAYRARAVEYEVLGPEEVERRWPYFRLNSDEVALWECETRVILLERVLREQLRLATAAHVALRFDEPLLSWNVTTNGGVAVRTRTAAYEAGALVLCTGAWTRDHEPRLETVAERQVTIWFDWAAACDLPVFLFDCPNGPQPVYGMSEPGLSPRTIKCALHFGGDLSHPDKVDRSVKGSDVESVTAALRPLLPEIGAVVRADVCFYPNLPDRLFAIGALPDQPSVFVATGGSGFGARFTPLVGEIIAAQIVGDCQYDTTLLAPARFYT